MIALVEGAERQKTPNEIALNILLAGLTIVFCSGLDPDITPAAADFQVARIASLRHLSQDAVRQIVARHTLNRQMGILGEPRVNVLLPEPLIPEMC